MKTEEEKRWERMQQILLAENRGDGPIRIASQRTLFGIKSHVEQVVDAVAAEDEQRCREKMRSEGRSDSPEGASSSCSDD